MSEPCCIRDELRKKRYALVYVCVVPWKVKVCVWRRLTIRHTRLGVWKGVGRHASPRKNHGPSEAFALSQSKIHSYSTATRHDQQIKVQYYLPNDFKISQLNRICNGNGATKLSFSRSEKSWSASEDCRRCIASEMSGRIICLQCRCS